MRILHVITGLHTGGAETMLCRLLESRCHDTEDHRVVCLSRSGDIGERIKTQGVQVDVLNGKGRLLAPWVTAAASRIAQTYRPDIVQGWMYDGNLAAWWVARRCRAKLAWNVRHSVADIAREPFDLRLVIRLGARLSAKADAIIYNSRTAAGQHQALGYAADATRILPNGFDTMIFKPDTDARARIRAELGIGEDVFLIGHIARWHPMKDHLGFIRAAGLVARAVPDVRFLLAGAGVDDGNKTLTKAAEENCVRSRISFLGERTDVSALNAALDVAVSSSAWGEGFPNVIGEAMACGVPCVVTNVGDGRSIVGETGIVVPPDQPAALAEALLQIHRAGVDGRRTLGAQARARVIDNWSLDTVRRQYRALYRELMEKKVC